MKRSKSKLLFLILPLFLMLCVVGSFLFGFLMSDDKMRGYHTIRSFIKTDDITYENAVTTSIFIDLEINSIDIPTYRSGAGGALASFKDELILMTHEGRIFLVNEDKYLETKVSTPDSGFDDYKKAAASDKFKELSHGFDNFRFNDILCYSEDNNDYLVVSYTEYLAGDECYGTSISRLKLPMNVESLADIKIESSDWEVVYRTQPCLKFKEKYRAIEGHMAGGRIAYRGKHKIILGSGDYHWDGVYAPQSYSQLSGNDYGKVLEINLENRESIQLSIGNRNTQGVLVDTSGQVWVTEHGVRGGDELNLIENDQNYGWPNETLGTSYNMTPWPMSRSYGRHDKYSAPIYAWVPSVAVSGITQINNFHSSWDGDFLVSSLAAQKIFRVRVRDKRVLFSEPIDIGERIRYVHQHVDGKIILWTDSHKILFITPKEFEDINARLVKLGKERGLNDEQQEKFLTSMNICMECHEFNNFSHEKAPALGAIYNRRIGTTEYPNYSKALLSKDDSWNKTNLEKFLSDGQSFLPGSFMPNQGIKDPLVLESIIAFLEEVGKKDFGQY